MSALRRLVFLAAAVFLACSGIAEPRFYWPNGARAAVSLSFDDARASQVETGLAVLAVHGAKVTFYVVPSAVEPKLTGWKEAVAAGHEIGNHSLTHPCSGNFPWARQKALEGMTLDGMRRELGDANARVKDLLGVTPETFAYPCGQSFVGRGRGTTSYVPLVAELFLAGRGWLDESPNDPAFGDLAQVMAIEMDGKDFAQIRPVLEQARESGSWVVLAGHEIGGDARQTTRVSMLEALLPYARDPANGLWLAPVGTVAKYIRKAKGDSR